MEPSHTESLNVSNVFLPRRISVGVPTAVLTVAVVIALVIVDLKLMTRANRLQIALTSRANSMKHLVGASVPPLVGATLSGDLITVEYRDQTRETLLIVFSTTCPICESIWPYWEFVTKRLDPKKYRPVYVNLSGSMTARFMNTHYFVPGAPILAKVDPQTGVAYNLSLSPAVLLLSADAQIERVWLGFPKDDARRDLERSVNINHGGAMH